MVDKKKGLIVSVFLAALLIFSHLYFRISIVTSNDYIRAFMFLCVGYVVALLSEKLERSKRAVQTSKEIYETIFETTGTATMINEEDTSIFLVNKQFEKLSGYPKEEIQGKMKWLEFFSKEDLDKMIEYHFVRRVKPNADSRELRGSIRGQEGRRQRCGCERGRHTGDEEERDFHIRYQCHQRMERGHAKFCKRDLRKH